MKILHKFMIGQWQICSVNHHVSARSIEASWRFWSNYNWCEIKIYYLEDTDLKRFKEVKISDPYKGEEISKLECEAHIEKRVGTRLKKWNQMANLSLIKSRSDRPLGGIEWLTDKIINKFQNYFGLAIH